MLTLDDYRKFYLLNVQFIYHFLFIDLKVSATGTKKRLGFRRKQATSFSVHRSEEVAPEDIRHLVKQGSSVSSDGEGSVSGESSAA